MDKQKQELETTIFLVLVIYSCVFHHIRSKMVKKAWTMLAMLVIERRCIRMV